MAKTIYALFFNNKEKKFYYKSMEVEEGHENDFKTNYVSSTDDDINDNREGFCWWEDEKKMIETVASMNDALAKEEFTVVRCRDCNRFFIITKKEQDWYKSHEYQMPKRCLPCRKVRKANKATGEVNKEETSK